MRAPKYVGTFNLGPSYSSAYAETDAYVFDSLKDIRIAMRNMREGYGPYSVTAEWEDDGSARCGEVDDSGTPCVEDISVDFVRNVPGALEALETGMFSRATFGPRGGFRVEG